MALLAALARVLAACRARGTPAPTPTYSPQATTAAGLLTEGDGQLALSDFAGAQRAYHEAIAADPNFAPAYSHLADAHLCNPETHKEEMAEAQKATQIAPEWAEPFAYLARAYDWNGKVVCAGAWALARLVGPVDNLTVVALDPIGRELSSVLVRRERALWWTQGLIDDDAFGSLWRITNQ